MHPLFERVKRSRTEERFKISEDYYDETSPTFWTSRAQSTLKNQLLKETNKNVAKNVIFFLGDGMSIP